MFGSLFKAAMVVVTAPVAIVADVVTLGGALNDRKDPYTVQQVDVLLKAIDDALKGK